MTNQETSDPRDLPGIPWSVGAICAVCGNEMFGVEHLAPALHRKSNEECHHSCSRRPCSLSGERPELPPCDPFSVGWPSTLTIYLHGGPGTEWYWLPSFAGRSPVHTIAPTSGACPSGRDDD